MDNALFDKITNSEDEMIARAGIPRYKACTYLRAYIMVSLYFEPHLVISDTSVNLNRAFRTLVDDREGAGYTLEDLPQDADFDRLIQKGHIRFAARDRYRGNFSDALRVSQEKMKGVDLPGERYTKRIDEICSDKYVYWYNLDAISRKFTLNFKRRMEKDLYDNPNTLPENAKLLQRLIRRLADEETITYNGVKSLLKEEYNIPPKDSRYQYIRSLLRPAYDNNIPDLLGLDYCMSLNDIEPSQKQEWKLELTHEQALDCNFVCDVYGLAKLPVSHLTYIWESPQYRNWEKQAERFREGIFDINEYIEALNKYLMKINEVVADIYARTSTQKASYKNAKLSSMPIAVRHYVKADDTKVVIAKFARDAWNIGRFCTGLDVLALGDVFFKMLPNLVQKSNDFPAPPEKIKDAVIMQNRTEENGRENV